MKGSVVVVHFLVIVTAIIGGIFAVVAGIAKTKQLLPKKHVGRIYYAAYALMALSMFLWVLRSLIGPE